MFIYILVSLILYLLGYGRLNELTIYFVFGILLIDYLKHKKKAHHHNLVLMESISNSSPQKYINPLFKLGITLFFIVFLVVIKSNIVSGVVLIASIYHFVFINKSKFKIYRKFIYTPMLFILMSILGIIISFTKEPLGLLNIPILNVYITITRSSQERGLNLLFLSLSCISILINYSGSTPLGDVIQGLKMIKAPKVLIELMYLVYRYIFLLYYIFNLLEISGTSRLGFQGIKNKYKTSMLIGTSLFNKTFTMARDSYIAMESRLYNGDLKFIKKTNKYKNPIGYVVFTFFIIGLRIIERLLWDN